MLSISGKTVAEGAAGTTTPLVFTVAKAGATSKVVTVGYAVTGGTARSGEDYQAFRGRQAHVRAGGDGAAPHRDGERR